jgi:DNA replication licensing factor MCM7
LFTRAYVASARRVVPYVPRDLTEYIASAYAILRQEEAESDTPHSYTTARTLLSIIRISEVCQILQKSGITIDIYISANYHHV